MRAQVDILRLGQMGQGVGYDGQGNIYFVPGALPGDRVEVDYEPTEKKYRDARAVEFITRSPYRVDPGCPSFGVCGGCDWLDLDYAEQIKQKSAMLTHILERTGFVPRVTLPFLPSAQIYNYRSRIQLKRSGDTVGFYRRRTHELVPINNCRLADESLNGRLAGMAGGNFPRDFQNVELVKYDDGSVQEVYDSPHGAAGFTQVNRAQNEVLRRAVADRVGRAGARSVLELFCGDGNLTFAFADQIEKGVGFDASTAAIEKANREAAARKLSHLTFVRSAVGPSLQKKTASLFGDVSYDTLVLDPPRSGAGGALNYLVRPGVKNIVYISCSPISFSKDIRSLKKASFTLEDVQGIDMFPHTRHIELIARFRR